MFRKSDVKVYRGRYAGEYLVSDRSGKHFAIKDLSLCQRNIALFKVISAVPRYYGIMSGYNCGIKWRDGTESFFICQRETAQMVGDSIKNTVEPY